MAQPQKEPLRPLRESEQAHLEQIARSQRTPATQVARAQALLSVAAGHSFSEAARRAGRASGDAVAQLVARFNREGVAAVVPRRGGGAPRVYGETERALILAQARRAPQRETDGTATWSLNTLQRALRAQGLPRLSTYTIGQVLHEAGLSWQHNRSWCATGVVQRRRQRGGVEVVEEVQDVDAVAKKN